MLERIGQCGDLVSKARESHVSLARLLVFIQQATVPQITQDSRGRFRTLSRDVLPMSDHATFLGDKVQFLLDATLGMVSIDQNNILKIFSVVTLFMLPPSQPTPPLEVEIRHERRDDHRRERRARRPARVQPGNVLEIHSIESGDHR